MNKLRTDLRDARRPLLLALCVWALALAFLWRGAPSQLQMYPDSSAYIQFGPWAAAGYPTFLRVVGLGHVMAAQIFLFATSLAVLAYAVARHVHMWVGVGVALLALGNPEVRGFNYAVMSEPLFFVLQNLFLAGSLCYLVRRTWGAALAVGALCGLAICVRPVSYVMVAGFAAVWLVGATALAWRPRCMQLLGALACMVGIVACERSYTRSVHHGQLSSLAGPHLFAKAALLDVPAGDGRAHAEWGPLEQRLSAMLENDFAPVRETLRRSASSAAYPVLEPFYETCIEHACMDPLRAEAGLPMAELDSAMLSVAKARVRQAPLQFAALTLREYKAFWALYPRSHPSLAPEVDRFIAAARPLPLEQQLPADLLEPAKPVRLAYAVRPAFLFIGAVTHGVLLLAAWTWGVRRRPLPRWLGVAVLSAVSIVAVFAFNSLGGVGGSRYAMGMWPAMALMLAVVPYGLWQTVGGVLRTPPKR